MSSSARVTFEASREDVERLMQLHGLVGGSAPGRRVGLEVLNKSGVVLTCAIWEAYVEDLGSEVVQHYVDNTVDATSLPKDLQVRVAKELEQSSSKTAAWKLAGDGWKTELKNRLNALEAQRNTALNTPKSQYVEAFFAGATGISGASAAWSWSNMTNKRAKEKLDRYVTLRGDIAHRGGASSGVTKDAVADFRNHVERLAEVTDSYIDAQVEQLTGVKLFQA